MSDFLSQSNLSSWSVGRSVELRMERKRSFFLCENLRVSLNQLGGRLLNRHNAKPLYQTRPEPTVASISLRPFNGEAEARIPGIVRVPPQNL